MFRDQMTKHYLKQEYPNHILYEGSSLHLLDYLHPIIIFQRVLQFLFRMDLQVLLSIYTNIYSIFTIRSICIARNA
jgi:hypothetical protein